MSFSANTFVAGGAPSLLPSSPSALATFRPVHRNVRPPIEATVSGGSHSASTKTPHLRLPSPVPASASNPTPRAASDPGTQSVTTNAAAQEDDWSLFVSSLREHHRQSVEEVELARLEDGRAQADATPHDGPDLAKPRIAPQGPVHPQPAAGLPPSYQASLKLESSYPLAPHDHADQDPSASGENGQRSGDSQTDPAAAVGLPKSQAFAIFSRGHEDAQRDRGGLGEGLAAREQGQPGHSHQHHGDAQQHHGSHSLSHSEMPSDSHKGPPNGVEEHSDTLQQHMPSHSHIGTQQQHHPRHEHYGNPSPGGHSYSPRHDISHSASNSHSHNHEHSYRHSYEQGQSHDHGHGHGHSHSHEHGHDHGHVHGHGHGHDHGHDHDLGHDPDEGHSHNHSHSLGDKHRHQDRTHADSSRQHSPSNRAVPTPPLIRIIGQWHPRGSPMQPGEGAGKVLFVDAMTAGVAGDMLAAALLDLGVPVAALEEGLRCLGLEGFRCRVEGTERSAITAPRFVVEEIGSQPLRDYAAIRHILQHEGSLSVGATQIALDAFELLAQAEAGVHGVPVDHVHFHEVGAIDSIVDIVACAVGLDYLGVLPRGAPEDGRHASLREGTGLHVAVSALPMGRGIIRGAAHGPLPCPAPATVEILCRSGIPSFDAGMKGELVTPTGACLLGAVKSSVASWPSIVLERAAYGAGTKSWDDRPNLLRLVLGQPFQSA